MPRVKQCKVIKLNKGGEGSIKGQKMKNMNQTLLPVDVSSVYSVVSHRHKNNKLRGFVVTVTYNGCAKMTKRSASRMGILSGGYGSDWVSLDYDSKTHKTRVEYIFHSGLLFPEPLGKASEFRDNVKNAIENFKPVDISGIGADYKKDIFGEICMHGYKITVKYPVAAQNNPLFKKFITHNKPKVAKVFCDGATLNVVYVFKVGSKVSVDKAYSHAMTFKTHMLEHMKHNENIK